MGKERIILADISKSYYSEAGVTQALHKINLTFCNGEFVAVTGESGSGKSTLLSVLGGILSFDEGEMTVDGDDTFKYDEADWEEYRRNKVSFVFQDYSLVDHMTVLENVVTGMLTRGISTETAGKKAGRFLEMTGLSQYADHKAFELSSGQKQRLSIARALAKETGIILADEPTGNLDPDTGNEIMKLLKDLSKNRVVIAVTHNRDQALHFVTREIRINDGQVVADTYIREKEEAKETACRRAENEKGIKNDIKTSLYLTKLDLMRQKGRTLLFTIFLFLLGFIALNLATELAATADDVHTKVYSGNAFAKEDDTRLVAKKVDGSPFLAEEINKIGRMDKVNSVDPCDTANDFNYYPEEGKDYKFLYSVKRHQTGDDEIVRPEFLTNDKFVRSVASLRKNDLVSGKLPEKEFEVVVRSGDKGLIGKEFTICFTNNNLWGADEYTCAKFNVTGIVKGKKGQFYFSEAFSDVLGAHIDSGKFRLYTNYNSMKGDYDNKNEFIPVVMPDLTGNDVRLSGRLGYERPQGSTLFYYEGKNDEGELTKKEDKVNILPEGSLSSANVIEVSREFFDKYYKTCHSQLSVYIESYAYTDMVIGKLKKNGFTAISTFKISTGDYDGEKVNGWLLVRGICAGGLVIIFFTGVMILARLMMLTFKEYKTLRFIGIRKRILRNALFVENAVMAAAGFICAFVVQIVIAKTEAVSAISTGIAYMEPGKVLLAALYLIFLSLLAAKRYEKGAAKKSGNGKMG